MGSDTVHYCFRRKFPDCLHGLVCEQCDLPLTPVIGHRLAFSLDASHFLLSVLMVPQLGRQLLPASHPENNLLFSSSGIQAQTSLYHQSGEFLKAGDSVASPSRGQTTSIVHRAGRGTQWGQCSPHGHRSGPSAL